MDRVHEQKISAAAKSPLQGRRTLGDFENGTEGPAYYGDEHMTRKMRERVEAAAWLISHLRAGKRLIVPESLYPGAIKALRQLGYEDEDLENMEPSSRVPFTIMEGP